MKSNFFRCVSQVLCSIGAGEIPGLGKYIHFLRELVGHKFQSHFIKVLGYIVEIFSENIFNIIGNESAHSKSHSLLFVMSEHFVFLVFKSTSVLFCVKLVSYRKIAS